LQKSSQLEETVSILVINGPNLNLLGVREPGIYGSVTLPDIEASVIEQGEAAGHSVECFQSNHEGAIVDRIHLARTDGTEFVIINPGAYTHTSVAIRDAFSGVAVPFCEVHISNVHQREAFRHHSYLSDVAVGVMAGFGVLGYNLALEFVIARLAADRA
jgi:3-dehydroquinate dehydratase-2